jgi:hypothetical protein
VAWHVLSAAPRSQRQALGDLATALGVPEVPVTGIPWPVLRGIGIAVPMMREVVAVRHRFDQPYVIDVTATTATFGIAATPWEETVRAAAGGTRATT